MGQADTPWGGCVIKSGATRVKNISKWLPPCSRNSRTCTRRAYTGAAPSAHWAYKGSKSQNANVVSGVPSEPCASPLGHSPDQHRTLTGHPPDTHTLRHRRPGKFHPRQRPSSTPGGRMVYAADQVYCKSPEDQTPFPIVAHHSLAFSFPGPHLSFGAFAYGIKAVQHIVALGAGVRSGGSHRKEGWPVLLRPYGV